MSQASLNPAPSAPQPSSWRPVAALTLGALALISFALLVLPTDLILVDLPGFLGPVAQALNPLALGPEILFSPIGLLAAIAAIVVGRSEPSASRLAQVGRILGWLTVALYLLSLGLIILSVLGVVKPLI
ncbi:MAG TPA: hypothetical protein VHR15_17950 [Ktedonobacterales bacterium]|jgi:hypothetical protein|nr:hypothetical protein [Ktedonobacterales bacterium]